jgi:hypothetical protein
MSMTGTISQGGRQSSQGATSGTSAMPLLARNPKSVWARSAELRDYVYAKVEDGCRDAGTQALVNKSRDIVYPAWVSLEAWLPAGAPGATRRRFLTITIDPKPYMTFEYELTIRCNRDGEIKIYGPYEPHAADSARAWASYMLDHGPEPSKTAFRLRKLPWEFWYPRNKVTRLSYDLVALGALGGIGVAILGGFLQTIPGLGIILTLGGLIGAGVCFFVARKRRKVVINAGQPVAEPRSLRLADSWQTMLYDLGGNWENVRERLFRRLADGRAFNIEPRLENISYLTADGKQEREQLVLSQGRGLVFCHIYQYGNDLFIGWVAHLNHGRWVETTLASGFDSTLQLPSEIKTVAPGSSLVTEYDLIDLNSLTEWVHSRVVKVIKQVLAEHKLDQEIDFKIVRGERQSLLRESDDRKRSMFSRGAPVDDRDQPQSFSTGPAS